MDTLAAIVDEINTWQSVFLTPKKWKAFPEENLCDKSAGIIFDTILGSLVEPLAKRTLVDKILVLCPSSALYRLPLYALSIKTPDPDNSDDSFMERLIERNPIVYIHSHSLLRSCFYATKHVRESLVTMNPKFVSGIPEANPDFTTGRKNIQGLADLFITEPIIDSTTSKENFISAVTESRLLHIHTHCNWDFKDPLDHHIKLPIVGGAAKPGMYSLTKLTAREIFDFRVLPATHINVIACKGGVIEVQQGDEVMGLVPALLYCGASSTISTL